MSPERPQSRFWGPHFVQSLKRSQIAALAATAVDFGVLAVLVQFLSVWYVAATAMGALSGAVTNFLMNRHWAFEAADGHWAPQGARYVVVSGASLGLNTLGVYWFTEALLFHYMASKLVTALAVGLFFNFPLHKYYVFRTRPE